MPKKNKHWAKFRFELVKNLNSGSQKYHWRVVACNGRIICSSETYTTDRGPDKTMTSFIEAIQKGQYKLVPKIIVVKKTPSREA